MRIFAGVPQGGGVKRHCGCRHYLAISVATSSETLERRPALSADKDRQESCAVAGKPHDAVVKFDTYRNLQRHRAVLPATGRLFVLPYFVFIAAIPALQGRAWRMHSAKIKLLLS